MSRRRKETPRRGGRLWLVPLAALVAGGFCVWRAHPEYLERGHWLGRRGQAGRRTSSTGGAATGSRATRERTITARIYFLRVTDGKQRLAAVDRPVAAAAPVRAAVAELLTGELPQGCDRPLPPYVELLGAKVMEGVASVDFSKHLTTSFRGGSDSEGVAVYAIVNTLTSLPGVDQVQILVEGQRVDSIGGHLDVSGPLARDDELVVVYP